MSSRWLSFCCALWELWLLHVQVSAPTWEAMRRCIWQLESLHLYPNPWPGRKKRCRWHTQDPIQIGCASAKLPVLCDAMRHQGEHSGAFASAWGGTGYPQPPVLGLGPLTPKLLGMPLPYWHRCSCDWGWLRIQPPSPSPWCSSPPPSRAGQQSMLAWHWL